MIDNHPEGATCPTCNGKRYEYGELFDPVYPCGDCGGTGIYYDPPSQQTMSHADYLGGEEQYKKDVETLQSAGMLADKATVGEWSQSEVSGFIYSDVQYMPLVSGRSTPTISGYERDDVFINSIYDRDLIVNAANVARALARFMPYMMKKLGGI